MPATLQELLDLGLKEGTEEGVVAIVGGPALAARAKAITAAFDESEHPRHPAGTREGGRFAPKGGAASTPTGDDLLGSGRDPDWTGPVVIPSAVDLADFGLTSFPIDPVRISDAAWDGGNVDMFGLASIDQGELDEALRLNDMTLDEYKSATALMLKMDAQGDIIHREPAIQDRMLRILETGRLKSQFETGTSSGALNPGSRAVQEGGFFGYPDDLPVEQRPIYGYVDGTGTGVEEQYGDALFTLKDSVRTRTTATGVDSLSRPVIPGPINNPGWRAAVPPGFEDPGMLTAPDYLTEGFVTSEFIETQTHGGVTLDDIESLVIEIDVSEDRDDWMSLFRDFADRGVRVEWSDADTGESGTIG